MSHSASNMPQDRRRSRRHTSAPPTAAPPPRRTVAPPSSGPSSISPVTTVETSNQMKEILNGRDESNLVVLEFMAPWSEPSKSMELVYEQVASNDEFIRKNVRFFKVNFDKFQNFAAKLRVEAMPVFLMIKGRTVIDRIVAIDKEELSRKIREHATTERADRSILIK